MLKIVGWFLAVNLGLKLTAAMAQGIPATDNELYAGYCLGVSAGISKDPSLWQFGEHNQTIADELKRRKQRFTGYLVSRGVLTSPNRAEAQLGVLTAERQGEEDETDCSKEGEHCYSDFPAPKLDPNKPLSPSSRQNYLDQSNKRTKNIAICSAKAASATSCRRVQRCGQPGNLPF
jgi:hypothetical protein